MTDKIKVGNDGFVTLVDHMGSDTSICNAARVSYGNHNKEKKDYLLEEILKEYPDTERYFFDNGVLVRVNKRGVKLDVCTQLQCKFQQDANNFQYRQEIKNRNLIRYLMRHQHTTPFEMVEFIFLVRAPIHVARQWFRHRTWSYNEYSTRYKEAIDSFETTDPEKWRTQAKNNKQGSEGYVTEWPEGYGSPEERFYDTSSLTPGDFLTKQEKLQLERSEHIYKERLHFGVSREQARKDLPLSTYTEFYAKVDLHNLSHFLSLRLDSHAQLEIREFAQAISNIIQPIIPISYEAFEDYRLNGAFFSAQEMEFIKNLADNTLPDCKPDSMSDREWKEFLTKLGN